MRNFYKQSKSEKSKIHFAENNLPHNDIRSWKCNGKMISDLRTDNIVDPVMI